MKKEKRNSSIKNEQRDSAAEPAESRFLVIGRILKPHGVRGELRVEILTELPERFTWLDSVYIGKEDPTLYKLEGVRFHKSLVLLKLKDCDDRNSADLLRSQLVQIPEAEGLPLEEGEYYLHQVIGLEVYTEEGDFLGHVKEMLETKANNVFVVRDTKKEILLPDIDEVIREIDFDSGRILVTLLPGLLT